MLPRRINRVAPLPTACPLKFCMGFLGGAWTPNIIWFLSGTPRRFGELKHDLAGISAKMLTQRLRQLIETGVVEHVPSITHPQTSEYRLTSIGSELIPAIQAIVDVGHRLKMLQGKGDKIGRKR